MLGPQVPVIAKVSQEEKEEKGRKEKERSANMTNEERMLEDNEIDPERSGREILNQGENVVMLILQLMEKKNTQVI